MNAATLTQQDLTERIEHGLHSPRLRLLTKIEDVARLANDLGKQGHGVKRVEFIYTEDHSKLEPTLQVRVVPDFALRSERATRAEAEERAREIRQRVAQGETHQQIADALGMERSTVSYYASTRYKHEA
jgi:DNA-binding NarL/FixJ family response regulator